MITHISLFSGIGGAEGALDACGVAHTTLFRSEINKKADLVYQHIHDSTPEFNIGDMTRAVFPYHSSVDLITGGFPCQPFSNLGFRKGMKDERFVKPFTAMLNIFERYQPKYIMLENVRLSEEVIRYVMKSICALGYKCHYKLMCPHHDLGYVQKRKRLYMTFWRSDLEPWFQQTEVNRINQQFHRDPEPFDGKNGNCYAIQPKRVVNIFDDFNPSVGCITARGHEAHCKYMTWLKCQHSRTGFRGYTPWELWQLFGWQSKMKKFETVYHVDGISRSSFCHAMGNSWHVGHAKFVLSSCPLVTDQLEEQDETV